MGRMGNHADTPDQLYPQPLNPGYATVQKLTGTEIHIYSARNGLNFRLNYVIFSHKRLPNSFSSIFAFSYARPTRIHINAC